MDDSIKKIIEQTVRAAPSPVKPKLWMLYARDAYTTARHVEEALKATGLVDLVPIGPGHAYQDGSQINLSLWAKRLGAPAGIFVMDGATLVHPVGLEMYDGPKLYWAIDTHLVSQRPRWLYAFDKIFVCHARTIGDWKLPNMAHLPVAADPAIHREIPHVPVVYDISFVGGADLSEVQWRRRELLGELVKHFTTYAGRTTGLWMSFVYSKSKLVFNCSVKGDVNMRVFEGMACRRVVVTDACQELADLGLKDGEQLVTYDTKEELIEKVKGLLADDARRNEIADRGLAWVLAANTYQHRALVILDALKDVSARGERKLEGAAVVA